MFTREDFEDYFEELKKKEELMLRMQRELLAETKNEKVKADINKIIVDEIEHEKIINQIEDIIKVGKPRF